MAVQRTIEAVDHDFAPDIDNSIHTDEGGRAYGFEGTLLGGVTVLGWTIPAVLDAFGEAWLDSGWLDVRFRRPVYGGDTLTLAIDDDGGFDLAKGGTTVIGGTAGLGDAPGAAGLALPERLEPAPAEVPPPRLTPANVPVGQDLKPFERFIGAEEAATFARETERTDLAVFSRGGGARGAQVVHPAWLLGQMIRLLHHSYDYGPAIHTGSLLVNLAPAIADQTLVVAGRCVDAFEKKGHHYIVNDGCILDSSGDLLARLRHTAIYQVARPA